MTYSTKDVTLGSPSRCPLYTVLQLWRITQMSLVNHKITVTKV